MAALTLFVYGLHAFPQAAVHHDFVLMGGQHGRHFGIHLLHGGVGGSGILGEEHAGHLAEQLSAAVESQDGVLEGGCVLAGGDGLYLVLLGLHGLFEGG